MDASCQVRWNARKLTQRSVSDPRASLFRDLIALPTLYHVYANELRNGKSSKQYSMQITDASASLLSDDEAKTARSHPSRFDELCLSYTRYIKSIWLCRLAHERKKELIKMSKMGIARRISALRGRAKTGNRSGTVTSASEPATYRIASQAPLIKPHKQAPRTVIPL